MKIVQLGLGGVGQALLRQFLDLAGKYPWLSYSAISDRSGLCWVPGGWSNADLRAALEAKGVGQSLSDFGDNIGSRAHFFPSSGSGLPDMSMVLAEENANELVVVDVTAERHAYGTLLKARKAGAHIVMCNKWALAENTPRYEAFFSEGDGKVLYETTVGAALPVIGTLDRLLQTGDDVYRIEAAISGTLGYVCSEIQRGTPFSEALSTANKLGFTEPDPRDDLAGVDARRKALILARKMGQRLEMADVKVESLVPTGLESVSLDEFWRRLPEADSYYARRIQEAKQKGNVLRFLATIDEAGASVSLAETSLSSLAGSLNGTESLFAFHTRRYGDQPIAIRGRGAGADVTASGVLADILSLGQ